jgi:hypothetical protein
VADGRYALVVASSRYSDPTLTQLDAPAHDARSLTTVLAAPAIGDFEVTTLTDEPAPAVMQAVEAFFSDRRREDLVLLYFSGHGILDDGARLYFATSDTRVNRPRSTAVSAEFVNELMSECRSRRQMLILDCCNSGAFGRGVKAGHSVGTGERFEGRGRVVITASDALQYAFEGERVEGEGIGSVFTRALVQGLETGDADLNRDGTVTLDELYDYVYGRVLDASPRQRPHKWAFGVEGQIAIARAEGGAAQLTGGAAQLPIDARPAVSDAPPAAARRPPRIRRRGIVAVAGVLAVGVAVAAVAAVLLTGNGDGGTAAASPPASPIEAARLATVKVYEAWLAHDLASLDDTEISASARRTLAAMPSEPVAPSAPGPGSYCNGSPADVTCTYDYADPLPMHLTFRALREASGIKVMEIGCFDGDGNTWEGGMAGCAAEVRAS